MERIVEILKALEAIHSPSGYTDDVIAHRGVLEPGLVLMEKPLTPEAILRKVRGVLDA